MKWNWDGVAQGNDKTAYASSELKLVEIAKR